MSAAFKYAVLQAFCIAVQGSEDADATTHRLKAGEDEGDPVQGWEQWTLDMQDMVRICDSGEALDRVQSTYRALLRAASKRRPDLYAAIGQAVRERRRAMASPALQSTRPSDARQHACQRRQNKGSDIAEGAAHA